MSYSYIKSVFPNFESSKVYDDRIYNSLSSISLSSTSSLQNKNTILGSNEQLQSFTENLLKSSSSSEPSTVPIEKDNLKFYNKPFSTLTDENDNNHKQITKEIKKSTIEEFKESTSCENMDCNNYIQHILKCKNCLAVIHKQLGIDNDKVKMDEMIELSSYIIFGIFIILLLESLKKK
jgi:hypothetical protein